MLVLYTGAFRLPNYDAAAARVLSNAKSIQACGHIVKFISWGGSYRETDRCVDDIYRVDDFEYVITNELDSNGGFAKKIKSKLFRGNKTFTLLKSKSEIPDVIIMYNPGYKQTWQMLRYSKKNNITLISDITEWYSMNELHLTDWLPYYLNMGYLQKRVKNKIVISSYLNNYYHLNNNIVIPATCDASDSKWDKTHRVIDNFDGLTLIYAGNPGKKDCVHTVINVVQKLIDEGLKIRFIILGVNRENYITNHKYKLYTKSLNEKILFLGRVSQDLIPSYYNSADFMVLLRKPDRKAMAGFPTKFAESMMSGTPIISNATSDIKNYLRDGINGFLVDFPEENSLRKILENKVMTLTSDEIKKMKVNAYKTGINDFDYHSVIPTLSDFMKNLRR